MLQKVQKYRLNNLEVHTFHSFFRVYVDKTCETDKEIYLYFKNPGSILPMLRHQYAMIICDEAQDLKPLFFEVFLLILKCHTTSALPQLACFGDLRQSIYKYAFRRLDIRFILSYMLQSS